MRNKYTNEITKDFDEYNGLHHYMFYDDEDINNKELLIMMDKYEVGYVALNNSNKIFSVSVDTNLNIKYTDEFEKYVSDKYMDLPYEFRKDVKIWQ